MEAIKPQMMPEAQTQIFLRIKHPVLDPDEITNKLGLRPEHATKAGQDISATGVQRLFSESYWIASLNEMLDYQRSSKRISPDSIGFLAISKGLRNLFQGISLDEMCILTCLKKLESHKDFFMRIHGEHGSVTLILQRSGNGNPFTLTPTVARLFAELGVCLEID